MTKEVFILECNLIIKEIKKNISTLENKLQKLEDKKNSKKKSIIVKGYEISCEEDLNELVSNDIINSENYYKYLDKLKRVQRELNYKQKSEAIEMALQYFKRELTNTIMNLRGEENEGKKDFA